MRKELLAVSIHPNERDTLAAFCRLGIRLNYLGGTFAPNFPLRIGSVPTNGMHTKTGKINCISKGLANQISPNVTTNGDEGFTYLNPGYGSNQ